MNFYATILADEEIMLMRKQFIQVKKGQEGEDLSSLINKRKKKTERTRGARENRVRLDNHGFDDHNDVVQ